MCKLSVDIHRLMKLHVTCYFTINQHKSISIIIHLYIYIYLKEMHICLLNDISIMHYVQFGSNISPDYPYIVVFAFWISEYMAIAVESVEMGGGG